ncbi:glycoside hydrolase family 57 [Candidatus Methylacidiphilum infernorum]|uniref:Alpha-amylase/alpha-mannosidase n=1 Tax=Methylacidiphilum infernorum (isolate V4) TaxID=481448 RepID=B3DVN0_METI4|nr:glycoside hydrolase family 57 [Candidatus Methylacidiphilum infernorum]ACD83383.1 Alpha-amylase/alpha-mannosidase [Methylacidiphilum infernorum V4]
MPEIFHALGLHMHQPLGNLTLLLDTNRWEAEQILLAYERPLRFLKRFEQRAKVHFGFSGTLLEQLTDPQIQQKSRDRVDLSAMLEGYKGLPNIELVGMGYYHPVFPIIPKEDWEEQLWLHRDMVEKVFGKKPAGFFPPEMGFTMEMIPYLVEAGYSYAIVDSVHVRRENGQPVSPCKVYRAEWQGKGIAIVPRERDLSNAQQSGMDPAWFTAEIKNKTKSAPPPKLITTWTDGENGGWFRNLSDGANFWGYFFAPYMEKIRLGEEIEPVLLSQFIAEYPPVEKVEVRTGAWNVGSTSGYDFSQWTGTSAQKKALEQIYKLAARYWERSKSQKATSDLEFKRKLGEVRKLVLQAETSCYLFWGDSWLPQLYELIERAYRIMP